MNSEKKTEIFDSVEKDPVNCTIEPSQKSYISLDFDGLIIEVMQSNLKETLPNSNKTQQGNENKPPIVKSIDSATDKPMLQELPPKPKQSKPTPLAEHITNTLEGSTSMQSEVKPGASNTLTEEDLNIFKSFMDTTGTLCASNKLMLNKEEFVCSICEKFILKNEGAILKCLHSFCRSCLVSRINDYHDELGQVMCPFKLEKCEGFIFAEEVEELLGDEYGRFMLKIIQIQDAYERERIRNEEASKHDTLPALLETDNLDFIVNFEVFECSICFTDVQVGDGIILKNCLHQFCKDCIRETANHSEEFIVKCPYSDSDGSCEFTIQEREIRGLVSNSAFDKLLEKSLSIYEGASSYSYHCKSPDCKGFVEIDENLPNFICEVCYKENCVKCKVVHEGKSCREYQDEINPENKHQRENIDSENAIKDLIAANEAMHCPRCEIPVMKQEGCDFLTCLTCKLGICWRTKKPRLAFTRDNGTVIDGCHCRENGVKCDPLCGNCH